MANISLEQAGKLNEGGGKYFKLNPDESKQVRFLWDNWEEVSNNWCFGVHEIVTTLPDGKKQYSTVDCPRLDDAQAECKYCANKNAQVGRVIIPMFIVDEGKIQYWKRSSSWVSKSLKPMLDEVAHLPSIANQTFKIKRTGSGMNDTTYNVLPVMNASDNRTKADFGEIENPYEMGAIQRYGDSTAPAPQPQGNAQGYAQQGYAQPATGYQPSRRTTDVF